MAHSPALIALVGPTASGKTSFALSLAERLQAEILSVDSMQVYTGMDIGTAKPTPTERSRIPHHGIDVADPREFFSVADYLAISRPILEEFFSKERPLILCGGTGLYFKALVEGLAEAPPPDLEFRAELEARADQEGTGPLHAMLTRLDPSSAAKIHPHDRKRIIRALEIHHATGLSKTDFESRQESPPWKESVLWFGLRRAWGDLDRRIDLRVEDMFAKGLLDEVRDLIASGCGCRHTAMQALGYKEVLDHLEGRSSLDEAEALIKQRTRRFARRQMSWFRPNRSIKWLSLSPSRSPERTANELSERIHGLMGDATGGHGLFS
ncbi:MAG: tRNA (adenosine(37)-N6)-dimethylallyltransferase MiaA [Candidatus Omnitrophica bacterium]|nr:tRNA dimethylallyltransferase [bacterium]NUN98830.1 tRNA (adenosine(37)-N6)-dimethylallyltransferase MiaA [Candidatus Omnitrophota bacterium]